MNDEDLFARSTQLSTNGSQQSDPTIGSTSRERENVERHPINTSPERYAVPTTITQYNNPTTISTQSNRPTTTTIVEEIDSTIERYRKREIVKSQAIKFITTKLAFDLTRNEPSKDAAFNQYLTTIDS